MSSQRKLSIDIVRLVAAFGVVIIHLSPSTHAAEAVTQLFALFVVPFFLLISLYFFISKFQAAPSLKLSELRLDRILVPYVAWTVVYTLMRLLKFHVNHQALSLNAVGLIFFGTGAVQLYFVPLLLLFQAEALAVIILFRGLNGRWAGLFIAVGAVLFGYAGSAGGYLGFNREPEIGLIYVAFTFLLVFMQSKAMGRRVNIIIGWLIVVGIISTAFLGYPLNAAGMMRGPLVGYGVAALALNWRFDTTAPALRYLLTCSYGIYLAHVFFLESFEFAAQKLGWTLVPYSVSAKILMGGLICLGCIGFIMIARLHWLSSYLFLGEGQAVPQFRILKRQPKSQPLANGKALSISVYKAEYAS
jgi:peptidoglycan/LPS O-acetylase OafA/YrhL